MNDSQAISAVLHGDKDRYEELVTRYRKIVYAIAWSRLGDSDLSEDAAQETFVKAYSYLATLRDPNKFSWWLTKIARNICNSFGRRISREEAFKKRWAVLESAEQPEQVDNPTSLADEVRDAFSRLADVHREALTVFCIESRSSREAAALLGISETAMRTRLHRAKGALRAQLEQRLEDTLESLQPSERFNRSVMVLLPLTPKGTAIGAGGAVAAGAGKVSASVSFALWNALCAAVPAAVYSWLMSRLESANVRAAKENQFRKAVIRRTWLGFAVMMVVIMAVVFYLIDHVGMQAAYQLGFVLGLPAIYTGIRLARVNRRAVMVLVNILLMCAGAAAAGFLGAPDYVIPITFLVVFALGYSMRKQLPHRKDYNLFLRCATGGVTDTPSRSEPVEERRLSDLELRSFARFLGEQWLARDYSLKPGRLVVWTPGVQGGLYGPFAGTSAGSRITVTAAGACTATLSGGDAKSIRRLAPSAPGVDELQQKACRVMRAALGCFAAGRPEEARAMLTAQSDEAVFKKPVHQSTFWRVMLALGIAAMLFCLIAGIYAHHLGVLPRAR